MELFEQAADGEFSAIVILLIVGLFVLRFLLKLLIVQFPALAGGLFFGILFAAEDGVDLHTVLENPQYWNQLLPYIVPALAVGFVIWNVVLSILKAVFRSVFKSSPKPTQQAPQRSKRSSRKPREWDDKEDEIVTASEISAMKTRKRHMDEYESRKERIHQHELSHQDKEANQRIVLRRRGANKTVTRRIKT